MTLAKGKGSKVSSFCKHLLAKITSWKVKFQNDYSSLKKHKIVIDTVKKNYIKTSLTGGKQKDLNTWVRCLRGKSCSSVMECLAWMYQAPEAHNHIQVHTHMEAQKLWLIPVLESIVLLRYLFLSHSFINST